MPTFSKWFLHCRLSDQNLHAAFISTIYASHIIILITTVLTMLCEEHKL